MILLAHVAFLLVHAKEYANLLQSEESLTSQVLEKYNGLVKVANTINQTFGTLVTMFILEIISAYVCLIDQDEIFVGINPDWKTLYNFILYSTFDAVILFIAASAPYQVHIPLQC